MANLNFFIVVYCTAELAADAIPAGCTESDQRGQS